MGATQWQANFMVYSGHTKFVNVQQRQPRHRSRLIQSWPCLPLLQVGSESGLLPLALAIAGSMAVVKGRGSSAQAWQQLHKDLQRKEDLLVADDGANESLYRALDASFATLAARKKVIFLRMAVLSKGAVAPEEMLLNLWEVEVSVLLLRSWTGVGAMCSVFQGGLGGRASFQYQL